MRLQQIIGATLLACAVFMSPSTLQATTPLKMDRKPFISHNGRMIAFVRDEGQIMLYTGLTRLSTITGDPQQLGGEPFPRIIGRPMWPDEMFQPTISPDSTKIAWIHGYPFSNVYVTDLRTGKVTKISPNGGVNPFWSPDGKQLAYATPKKELKATNLRTKRTTTLATRVGTDGHPFWTKSGPSITLWRNGHAAINKIEPNGTAKQITNPLTIPRPYSRLQNNADLELSSDGKTLLFIEATFNKGNYDCKIWKTTAKKTIVLSKFTVKSPNVAVNCPKWTELSISGDGKSFAASVYGSIWRGDMRTGRMKQITKPFYQ